MKSLALVLNPEKQRAFTIAHELIGCVEKMGGKVYLAASYAVLLGCPERGISPEEMGEKVEGVVVIGGDGTLLATAREVAPLGLPLLGVNVGQLGFLTEIEAPDLREALHKLMHNSYRIEERMMLHTAVVREGRVLEEYICLNDAVIAKGAFARIIHLEAWVDGQYLDTYPADGLIIATPTGSTAYSLSAGGPLVVPDLELILLTPICPHTLYSRPLILPAASSVRVKLLSSPGEVMLTLDGQHGLSLQPGDEVLVKRAEVKTRLVKINDRNFFGILREKMKKEDRGIG